MSQWEDLHAQAVSARQQAAALNAGAADLEVQAKAAHCPAVESHTDLQCSLDVHGPDVQHDLRPQLTWPG